jgi:hypothetical protein
VDPNDLLPADDADMHPFGAMFGRDLDILIFDL